MSRVKAHVALQQRKAKAAKQKEAERRQVETLNRKHLAGLRVVQKNLVYVVGLNPKTREEDLLQTLRGNQYFGQYGKIIKIVVSKAKETSAGTQTIGVYVTFARKEDAASCIAAVDGSQNGDRVLRFALGLSCMGIKLTEITRAQFGTTKYCSAYLRNEVCNNKGCMFLHETGDDNDSFSRQDLSSFNASSTQKPAAASSSSTKPSGQPLQPQPPPQQAPQAISAAVQPLARQETKDEPMSRSDSGDGSALPTTANWAKNPQIQQSRRSSMAASRSTPSPKTAASKLAQQISEDISEPPAPTPTIDTAPPPVETHVEPPAGSSREETEKEAISKNRSPVPESEVHEVKIPSLGLEEALKTVMESKFEWSLDRSLYDEETLSVIDNYPMLVDPNGGAIRHAQKAQQDRETLKRDEEEQNIMQAISTTTEDDENLASGSLQLGGEPEPQEGQNDSLTGQRNAFQQRAFTHNFEPTSHLVNEFSNMGFGGGVLTPAQQQQLLMLKSSTQAQDSTIDQFRRNTGGNTSMHQSQLSNPFVSQNQHLNLFPGHARQASRFNFTNDSSSSSATVKPATSAQLMAQQSAMMPTNQAKAYTAQQQQQQQQSGMHTFYSGVQGPPPGLKSTGTPPISGGGMFGQGHGFAGAMAGQHFGNGTLTGKGGDDVMRQFFPRRQPGMMGNGLGTDDTGKREFMFPSFLPKPTMPSSTPPAPGLLSSVAGPAPGAFAGYHDQGLSKQKKKGKKHRHANTSSSGGGGIVDLADPSILQARMHHGGAGQGPYNASQGQGGYASNMMYGGGFGGQRY